MTSDIQGNAATVADRMAKARDVSDQVRVDDLRVGDEIIGTGPSGPYEDGSRVVKRIAESVPSGKRAEYRLWFVGGGSLVYFGETLVTVGKRAPA